MDALIAHITTIMFVGLLVVLVVGQVRPGFGALLGVALWGLIAALGTVAYDRGAAIGLLSVPFTRSTFYLFCGAMAAMNGLPRLTAWRARRRR